MHAHAGGDQRSIAAEEFAVDECGDLFGVRDQRSVAAEDFGEPADTREYAVGRRRCRESIPLEDCTPAAADSRNIFRLENACKRQKRRISDLSNQLVQAKN